MSKGFSSNWRTVFIACGIFACFGTVVARLVYLQVLHRPDLLQYVERARREILVDQARRGDILDTHGNVLAASRSQLTLGVDPQMLRKEDEDRWPDLAHLLGMPLNQLTAQLNRKAVPEDASDNDGPAMRPVRWVKLSENVDESVNDEITKLKIRGVYAQRHYRRAYPGNTLAAHLIGYVNKEGVPAAGLEHYLDFYLRGQDGWRESEKDGLRRELAQFRTREVTAADGYTVVLTLDSVIQHMIENELQYIAGKFNPAKATIIVSEPGTGAILGLANYPTFNLNEFNKADMSSERNVAVADIFEPGSTFKIVAASGALNEGLVTPATVFDCGATTIDYKGRTLKLPRDDHPFTELTVADIICHSSNRGAAQLGMLLGEDRMYKYARAFGFGEKTGFPVGGETAGELAPVKRWDGLTITRLPMGHSVGATPLQIHYAMGALANGGVLMRPQIVRQIRDADGALVNTIDSVSLHRVVSGETAHTMAQMLMRVASADGTAPEAAIPNFDVAGKTGTTQKLIDGKYSTTHHVASFVGFFPAGRPRVVISVIVDDGHPAGGGVAYGKLVAAPSFKHIGEQLIQYLDIKPILDTKRGLLVMEGGSR